MPKNKNLDLDINLFLFLASQVTLGYLADAKSMLVAVHWPDKNVAVFGKWFLLIWLKVFIIHLVRRRAISSLRECHAANVFSFQLCCLWRLANCNIPLRFKLSLQSNKLAEVDASGNVALIWHGGSVVATIFGCVHVVLRNATCCHKWEYSAGGNHSGGAEYRCGHVRWRQNGFYRLPDEEGSKRLWRGWGMRSSAHEGFARKFFLANCVVLILSLRNAEGGFNVFGSTS